MKCPQRLYVIKHHKPSCSDYTRLYRTLKGWRKTSHKKKNQCDSPDGFSCYFHDPKMLPETLLRRLHYDVETFIFCWRLSFRLCRGVNPGLVMLGRLQLVFDWGIPILAAMNGSFNRKTLLLTASTFQRTPLIRTTGLLLHHPTPLSNFEDG